MNNSLKLIAATSAMALLPAAGMLAQDTDFASSGDADLTSPRSALSVRFVGYGACTDLVEDYVDESVNLYGITGDYTIRFRENNAFSPELVFSLGIAYGEVDIDWYSWYYGSFEETISLLALNATAGFNFRFNCGNFVSLWFGPRLGISVLTVSDDIDEWDYSEDETKVGALYGAEFGADFFFTRNRRHGLTVSLGALGTTATPLDIDEQYYVTFSVGYKVSF